MIGKNNKPEIFISYAYEDASSLGQRKKEIFEKVYNTLKLKDFNVIADRNGGVNYKDSIREFMQRIGRGKYVIVIISDKYLKSKYCMYEVLELLKYPDFKKRIFPIILEDANIYDASSQIDYLNYWQEKIDRLNEKIRTIKNMAYSASIYEELKLFNEIYRIIADFSFTLSDMNVLTPDIHQNNHFQDIIDAIAPNAGNSEEKKYINDELIFYKILKSPPGATKRELATQFVQLKKELEKELKNTQSEGKRRIFRDSLRKLDEASVHFKLRVEDDQKISLDSAPKQVEIKRNGLLKITWFVVIIGIFSFVVYKFHQRSFEVVLISDVECQVEISNGINLLLSKNKPKTINFKPGIYLIQAKTTAPERKAEYFIESSFFKRRTILLLKLSTLGVLHNNQPIEDHDENDFLVAQKLNSRTAFEFYLSYHPEGKYADRAKEIILLFDDKHENKKNKTDLVLTEKNNFRIAQTVNSIESYNTYISKYPSGIYVAEAEQAIEKLVTREKYIRDEADYKSATSNGTIPAFEEYIHLHTDGQYVADATKAISAISTHQNFEKEQTEYRLALNEYTITAFETYIEKFPDGQFRDLVEQHLINLRKENPDKMIFVTGGYLSLNEESSHNEKKLKIPSFFIDKYEVTVAEYQNFCNKTGRKMPVKPRWGWLPDYPMVNISYRDAVDFAQWKGKRLPTEHEWEYVASKGDEAYNSSPIHFAWFYNNSKNQPHQVGLKRPNSMGVYDLYGNVWEWCSNEDSGTTSESDTNQNQIKVLKGGAWITGENVLNCSYKITDEPDSRSFAYGFRCVRN
jgi:outer membrane protein assembly factor BamD (BamD/ComL family)